MFLKEEERPAGEPAKVGVGTLKLSEAIRIGATKRPQAFEWSCEASCVLMAGYEGLHGHMPKDWRVVNQFVDELYAIPQNISGRMMQMNDDEKLPREKIADWLESQGY